MLGVPFTHQNIWPSLQLNRTSVVLNSLPRYSQSTCPGDTAWHFSAMQMLRGSKTPWYPMTQGKVVAISRRFTDISCKTYIWYHWIAKPEAQINHSLRLPLASKIRSEKAGPILRHFTFKSPAPFCFFLMACLEAKVLPPRALPHHSSPHWQTWNRKRGHQAARHAKLHCQQSWFVCCFMGSVQVQVQVFGSKECGLQEKCSKKWSKELDANNSFQKAGESWRKVGSRIPSTCKRHWVAMTAVPVRFFQLSGNYCPMLLSSLLRKG